MTKSTIFTILLSIALTSCGKQGKEKYSPANEIVRTEMTDKIFLETIEKIKTSGTYENSENWEARGLTPSGQSVVVTLRKATNDFLEQLEKIYNSSESSETKLTQVSEIVDALSWDQLDTEEKEFMADELAPAIKAAGFNPWALF